MSHEPKPLTMDEFENNTAMEWSSGAYHLDIRATILERDALRATVKEFARRSIALKRERKHLHARLDTVEALLAATQEQHARAAAEAVRLRAALVNARPFLSDGVTFGDIIRARENVDAVLRGEP